MFEIGNSLREARLRRGLDLREVEAETKVRAKYLEALEDEEFETLPAETYVKGFLRTYAEYLGLDGQVYVDEFNSRFASVEEPVVSRPRSRRAPTRSSESNFILLALAGIAAVTVLVVVAWQFGSGNDASPPDGGEPLAEKPFAEESVGAQPAPSLVAPSAVEEVLRAKGVTEAPTETAEPKPAKLVVTASRGSTWLSVRAGSPTGELLYEGTLEAGQTQRFTRKRIWIQVGLTAENLDVKLNGELVKDFPQTEAVVVVTAKGVRTISAAE